MIPNAPTAALEIETLPPARARLARVCVVPRNQHWEVEVDGRARPMIDWLCTRERATEHALEQAAELLRGDHDGVVVVIKHSDHSVEDVLGVHERRRI